MNYVGLDIHTTRISICVLDEAGPLVRRCQVRGLQEMLDILKGLPDRFEVGYEASCGYGHYHDLLQPLAARVVVAHPGQLRLTFRSRDKNDRKDAERLAKLLYLGETPAVHVPSLDVRTWRELINCRGPLIAKRTRARNALRALLRGAGVIPPRQPALWTKAGLAWLRRLDLPATSQQLRRDLLRGGRDAQRPAAAPRTAAGPPGAASACRRPAAHHPRGGRPHRGGGGGVRGRPGPLPQRQGGRPVLRAGPLSGPVGRPEPAGAHHARRAGGRAPAGGRGRLPGAAPLADGPAYFERVERGDPQRKKIAVVATAHYQSPSQAGKPRE
jgi:hypothetical protein